MIQPHLQSTSAPTRARGTTPPPRLCAICASRPATAEDLIDRRRVPVCSSCTDDAVPEPPPPPTTRERVLRMLGMSAGMDIVDLAAALGEDSELGRAKVSAALSRCVRAGLVRHSGRKMDRTYHLAIARR